jgi:hypothetical protein
MLRYRLKCVKSYTHVSHKDTSLTMVRQCAVPSPTRESMILAGNSPKPALQPDSSHGRVVTGLQGPYREATLEARKQARFRNVAGWWSFMYTQRRFHEIGIPRRT